MRLFLALFALLCLSACARKVENPTIVQMRVRTMQTRTFAGADLKKVMKETIAVLQDEGFMIKTANTDIGLLTAERDIDIEKFSSKFWAYFFSGKRATWKKHSTVEITTNIMEDKGGTKIRINFLVRVFDNLGRVLDVHQVMEEEAYQDFFNKIQKGIIASDS